METRRDIVEAWSERAEELTTVTAVTRLGKEIRCHIGCAPLIANQHASGAMLIVEELSG